MGATVRTTIARIALGGALMLTLAGCGAGQPMDFPTPASELDKRPGILTGDDGEWIIYRR
jgi:predicted small lipoprotein YifL